MEAKVVELTIIKNALSFLDMVEQLNHVLIPQIV